MVMYIRAYYNREVYLEDRREGEEDKEVRNDEGDKEEEEGNEKEKYE